jgi:beta-glucanase (GH16 family)
MSSIAGRVACLFICFMAIPAEAGAATPDLTGYKLILDDEFNGTSLDLSKWQVGTNPKDQQWGSDSYFVTSKPSDAALFPKVYIEKGGVLTIRANHQDDFADPNHWGRKWYSGMITTAFADSRPPSAMFRRGYVEIRQKFPAGKGVWPADWAGTLKSNPLGDVELDGLEAYGVDMTKFHTTIHNWKNGKELAHVAVTAENLPDLTADFHTYGYLVGDTDVRVYLDGTLVNQVALYHPDTLGKFYWMFNLAMGGGWPITIPPNGGYDMQIDYIRIFSKDPDAVETTSR